MIAELQALGGDVVGFDPTVKRPLDGIGFAADAYAACEGVAVLAVLTEWDDFRWLDLDKVGQVMTNRAMVDARHR